MGKKSGILALLVTMILAICLSFGLYHWDNKYTHSAPQPISGILFPQENHLHYLTREWIFYPDVLLTPQDVTTYQGYRQYVDLGGTQPMDHGSGTYQLSLMLPETPTDYALELPEVFSAYRLYIGGTLTHQLGNPDPQHYQVELASEVIPFTANGPTQILLAVTDFDGVYSGLCYPPTFAPFAQVQAQRELRLVLHSAAVLIALSVILFSLLFGIHTDRKKGLFGALLGWFVIGISGYPLLHSLLHVPFHLTYLMEGVCHYALLTLALFLQCDACELSPRRSLLFSLPGLLVTVLALFYFATGAQWSGSLFSTLALCLKCYTSLCLIALIFYSRAKEIDHLTTFQCGALLYSVFLLADRLLPLYEPIVGGWFGEVGGVCLALALICGLWQDTLDAYQFRKAYSDNHRRMEARLAMQKNHYLELSQQIKSARESAHDLRHHMRVLRSMADQAQFPQLVDYLNSYEPHLDKVEIQVWSDHPVADSILAHYAAITHKLGGTLDAQLTLPPDLTIPDDEFCVILSNILENATEALARQEDGPRRIFLRGAIDHQNLGIVMDNTFNGTIRTREGHYLSSKHQGLGLGLSSVSAIVDRHGGLADFSCDGTTFHTAIMLPLS